MDAYPQLTDQTTLSFRPDLWNNPSADSQLSSLAPLPAFQVRAYIFVLFESVLNWSRFKSIS